MKKKIREPSNLRGSPVNMASLGWSKTTRLEARPMLPGKETNLHAKQGIVPEGHSYRPDVHLLKDQGEDS